MLRLNISRSLHVHQLENRPQSLINVQKNNLGLNHGFRLTFSDEKTPYDSVLDSGDYKVYVDSVALNYMRGVEIDFIDKGMGEASFVFNNVFAATGGSGGCGSCGSSSGGCS